MSAALLAPPAATIADHGDALDADPCQNVGNIYTVFKGRDSPASSSCYSRSSITLYQALPLSPTVTC